MKSCLLLMFITLLVPISGRYFKNHQKYSLTLTSEANLEKLYFIEEELLQTFSGFLRQEEFYHKLHKKPKVVEDEEDEADKTEEEKSHIEDIKKNIELLDESQRVHKTVGPMIKEYISHPINIYHIMRRLRRWTDAITVIFKSESCQKWRMPELMARLINIKESVPTEENFENVAYDLVILQHIYGLEEHELFSGNIFNKTSLDPLSPRDVYDIARIAYKREDYYYAVRWSKYLTNMFTSYDIPDDVYGFSMKNLFAIMSSSYYPLKQYRSAMIAAQMILRIDPDNKLAQVNSRFFESLLDDEEQVPLRRIPPGDKIRRKYEAICKGTLKKSPKITKHYYCKFQKGRNIFLYEKMEILNFRPKIIVFHDVFDRDTGAAVAYLGYKPMSEYSYKDSLWFQTPHFTVVPEDRSRIKWVARLRKRLENLPMAAIPPFSRGQLEVRNVGFEGLYYDINDAKHWTHTFKGGQTASMFAFLNKVVAGGEVVFPFHKVRITPSVGKVVFFFPSRSFMMVCPVAYGTEWFAATTFYESVKKGMCRDHER